MKKVITLAATATLAAMFFVQPAAAWQLTGSEKQAISACLTQVQGLRAWEKKYNTRAVLVKKGRNNRPVFTLHKRLSQQMSARVKGCTQKPQNARQANARQGRGQPL